MSEVLLLLVRAKQAVSSLFDLFKLNYESERANILKCQTTPLIPTFERSFWCHFEYELGEIRTYFHI